MSVIVVGCGVNLAQVAALLLDVGRAGGVVLVVEPPPVPAPVFPVLPSDDVVLASNEAGAFTERLRRRHRKEKGGARVRGSRRLSDRRAVYGSGGFFGRP